MLKMLMYHLRQVYSKSGKALDGAEDKEAEEAIEAHEGALWQEVDAWSALSHPRLNTEAPSLGRKKPKNSEVIGFQSTIGSPKKEERPTTRKPRET